MKNIYAEVCFFFSKVADLQPANLLKLNSFMGIFKDSYSRTSFNGCHYTISAVRLTSENYDCVYIKHVGNIKNELLAFMIVCYVSIYAIKVLISLGTLWIHVYSYHYISKIIGKYISARSTKLQFMIMRSCICGMVEWPMKGV